MPPPNPKHRDRDHDHDRKKPKPHGPKERELAVSMTVAILRAARVDGSIASIEAEAAGLYRRMYALVTDRPYGSEAGDERSERPKAQLRLGTSAARN